MGIDAKVRALRSARTQNGGPPVPDRYQGVTKSRIRAVLRLLSRESDDMVDVVFALLDDQTPSFYTKVSKTHKVTDGASTAHIACHVGILQRGGTRLDREGRDYWIKPLREVGAIEKAYLHPEEKAFISGWPVAKSSNCCVRLSSDFTDILKAPEDALRELIAVWASEDKTRERLRLQADAEEASKRRVNTKHADLIALCIEQYVPAFLPGFEVLYTDMTDGDRITDSERQLLSDAGISLGIDDAMPDVLLAFGENRSLWVIEAVTSDGEVDVSKVEQLVGLAARSGYEKIGFTTAYWKWKDAAQRQGKHRNVAPHTYIWIAEDASKHYLAESFDTDPRAYLVEPDDG